MYPHPTLEHIFGQINPARSGDTGRQWKGHCPAHDDGKMSLTVGLGNDDRILFHCQAGCSPDAVRQAFGLEWSDLGSPNKTYHQSSSSYPRLYDPPKSKKLQKHYTPAELDEIEKKLQADPGCRRGVERFARQLGIPAESLWAYGCRWKRIDVYPRRDDDPGELWCPEHDGDGRKVGYLIRGWDGKKSFLTGSNRGISFVVRDPFAIPGPVYLVEGHTDIATLHAIGLCAIGRPSNKGGIQQLATLLSDLPKSREIIVVGENDLKENGNWPGREGAEHTASSLAALLNRPIKAAMVPEPFKDSREWFTAPQLCTEELGRLYRKSLTTIATYPIQIPEVTEEELDQASKDAENSSPYSHPEEHCPKPGHMLLKHIESHLLRNVLNRCGSSSCPQCFRRKKRLRYESMCRHIDARSVNGGALYGGIREFTKKEWDGLRRGIIRKGGNVIRFLQPDGRFAVLCTEPFAGGGELSADAAKEFLKESIDQSVTAGRGKPFFSCTSEWAMVREKKPRQYEKLGTLKKSPQAVRRLCKQKGIAYRQKQPADSALLLDGYILYAAPDPENDPFVKLLLSCDTAESFGFPMHDSDTNPIPPGCKTPFPDWWNDALAEMWKPTG